MGAREDDRIDDRIDDRTKMVERERRKREGGEGGGKYTTKGKMQNGKGEK